STTAISLHRNAADDAMERWLGKDVSRASQQLLDYSMSLDVPGFYRAQQRMRRQIRKAVIFAGVGLGALIVILGLIWLAGSKSSDRSANHDRPTQAATP